MFVFHSMILFPSLIVYIIFYDDIIMTDGVITMSYIVSSIANSVTLSLLSVASRHNLTLTSSPPDTRTSLRHVMPVCVVRGFCLLLLQCLVTFWSGPTFCMASISFCAFSWHGGQMSQTWNNEKH